MGKKLRELKQRIKISAVSRVFEQGKLAGQTLKAYRIAAPILKHVDACPRCKEIFKVIHDCPDIKALPEGSFKEANQHIIEHATCYYALKQILDCPIYKEQKH